MASLKICVHVDKLPLRKLEPSYASTSIISTFLFHVTMLIQSMIHVSFLPVGFEKRCPVLGIFL